MINVLITSASRKVWLVEAFKNALAKCVLTGNIVAAETDYFSAACHKSSKFYIVPQSLDANFIPVIVDICRKENIQLLIPTRDAELPLFAAHRNFFTKLGVMVMVSEPNVIDVCNDKYFFSLFLKKQGLSGPMTLLPEEVNVDSMVYPCIVKSRYGSGGQCVFKVKNEKELKFFIEYISDPIVQEFIVGTEYTVDVFADFNGKIISIVPRERIDIVNGESYKSKTIKDWDIINQTKDLIEKLKAIGHLTVQCKKINGRVVFIEVNPRYGGAALLGIQSGANTPEMLLRLIQGESLSPKIGDFSENLIMLRYTQDIFLENKS